METSYRYEKLSDTLQVCVSPAHRFGTDAFLLASFASPRAKDQVCDLGTGCGIIPLAMLKNAPPAHIVGVELQEQAFHQLQLSIAASDCSDRVAAIHADLCRIAAGDRFPDLPQHGFDLVTCNPPYKKAASGILSGQTADQLARHEVACTIEDVCAAADRLLRYGGRLCICQRPERLCDVITAMKSRQIEPKRLRFVAKDAASPPWLFLLEGRKGGKPFLKVDPLLLIQGENGFSEELLKIYGFGQNLPKQRLARHP